MKKAFKIFKEGVTTKGLVQIVYKEDEPFDILSKIGFYTWLGYTVTDIQI